MTGLLCLSILTRFLLATSCCARLDVTNISILSSKPDSPACKRVPRRRLHNNEHAMTRDGSASSTLPHSWTAT